jgi:hypothetical protein
MAPHLEGCGPQKITLTKLDERLGSMETPEEIARDERAQNRAAVAANGDDFVEMLDLQSIVKRVANAMGGVEERNGAEHEKVKTHEGMGQDVGGSRVLGGLRPLERSCDAQDKEMDGNKESGDDTAGAEEDPQQRFDTKFGRLRVHSVFYPSRTYLVGGVRMIQEYPQELKPNFSRLQCRS